MMEREKDVDEGGGAQGEVGYMSLAAHNVTLFVVVGKSAMGGVERSSDGDEG